MWCFVTGHRGSMRKINARDVLPATLKSCLGVQGSGEGSMGCDIDRTVAIVWKCAGLGAFWGPLWIGYLNVDDHDQEKQFA
jgi:hypothetical protein